MSTCKHLDETGHCPKCCQEERTALARLARNFSAAMKHVEHKCDNVQALYVKLCWQSLDDRLGELLGPERNKEEASPLVHPKPQGRGFPPISGWSKI